jgi:hypothetical protein
MHPKLYKGIKLMEVFISDNQTDFTTIAKVYDFNDGVKVEISQKCRFIKLVILDKAQGQPASIDFMRVYGHQFFKSSEPAPLHSSQKERVEAMLIELGIPYDDQW